MAVKPLIGFGFGIIGAGLYWMLYNDAITSFFSKYIVSLTDKYYVMSDMVWQALPIIVILLGIVCLIFGSIADTSNVGGE